MKDVLLLGATLFVYRVLVPAAWLAFMWTYLA